MQIQSVAFINQESEADRYLVYVQLRADPLEGEEAPRPPGHLALALDASSSMGGPPMAAAIDAIRGMVDRLGEEDRLGLVVFDRRARVVFEPTEMTADAKAELRRRLSDIKTGVGTNLADGYRTAGELLATAYVPGGRPRVLLLTDGYPSVGPNEPAHFQRMAREFLFRGIATSTIGFGLGYDDHMLQATARAGDGTYHFVAYAPDLAAVLAGELRAAREVEATQTAVKLIPSGTVKRVELLHRYPTRTEPDGMVVEVGTVGRLGDRRLLFLVRSAEPTLGKISVNWKPVEDDNLGAVVLPVTATEVPEPDAVREARREYMMLQLAREERRAWYHLLRSNPAQARLHLQQAEAHVARMEADGLLDADEAKGNRDRLAEAFDVLDGRLEREAAFLRSQAYTSQVNTSTFMVGKDGSLKPAGGKPPPEDK